MIQTLFISLFESASLVVLWNSLFEAKRRSVLKSILFVFSLSLTMVLLTQINKTFIYVAGFLFAILFVFKMYKKSLRECFVELSVVSLFYIFLKIVILWLPIEPSGIYEAGFHFMLSLTFLLFLPIRQTYTYLTKHSYCICFFSINMLLYGISFNTLRRFYIPFTLQNKSLLTISYFVMVLLNVLFIMQIISFNEKNRSKNAYVKYSSEFDALITEVKRRQHDFKNHLNAIYGIVQTSDEKDIKLDLKNYIESLNSSLSDLDKIIQLDNTVLAGVIYSKYQKARDLDIPFFYNIKCSCSNLPFKEYEITEILSNLIDNAIDASLKLEKEDRSVVLDINSNDSCFFISVKNKSDSFNNITLERISSCGWSSKGKNRGYGLYNTKKIVESYGGKIMLSFESGFTKFEVVC